MLLWFRNDLRTHDNPAFQYFLEQIKSNEANKAVFFISEKQWRQHDWSPIKIDFIKRHAYNLKERLHAFNIELTIISVDDFSAQVNYLKEYLSAHDITRVIANSEVEFNEQQRDQFCLTQGIPLTLFESDVIVPKGKLLNKSDEMYKVFTPFKRAWVKHILNNGFDYLGKPQITAQSSNFEQATISANTEKATENKVKTEPVSIYTSSVYANSVTASSGDSSLSEKWPLAADFEQQTLPSFFSKKLSHYAQYRDIPSIKGTSGISPYLAAGLISPRFILRVLLTKYPDLLTSDSRPEFSWLNELIWREFYRHLLFHEQRLCKHKCFKAKYEQLPWAFNSEMYSAWCDGRTGYPLVDAAMRQLNQTGWMHNRLRMVVASFLTKHLLIDWRLGEKYFMQHLIDGDLAANNGGWQWAASTGCDAQPYFRIFNPIRQSERFDPNGGFIRKYLPELANIPDKHIHFPHKFIKENKLGIYWDAIVDHKEARLNALAFYK